MIIIAYLNGEQLIAHLRVSFRRRGLHCGTERDPRFGNPLHPHALWRPRDKQKEKKTNSEKRERTPPNARSRRLYYIHAHAYTQPMA